MVTRRVRKAQESDLAALAAIYDRILAAEEQGKTLLEAYPESEMAGEYRALAEQILNACREDGTC